MVKIQPRCQANLRHRMLQQLLIWHAAFQQLHSALCLTRLSAARSQASTFLASSSSLRRPMLSCTRSSATCACRRGAADMWWVEGWCPGGGQMCGRGAWAARQLRLIQPGSACTVPDLQLQPRHCATAAAHLLLQRGIAGQQSGHMPPLVLKLAWKGRVEWEQGRVGTESCGAISCTGPSGLGREEQAPASAHAAARAPKTRVAAQSLMLTFQLLVCVSPAISSFSISVCRVVASSRWSVSAAISSRAWSVAEKQVRGCHS